MKIDLIKGCGNAWDDTDESGIPAAVKAAKKADTVILCLGEPQEYSGEGNCRTEITLPGPQVALARAVLAANPKTAVVLFNGRPLAIPELDELAPAILEMWYPGCEGGTAAVNLLFGKANPCGKVTMSFPRTVGQVPIYYNHPNTGRPGSKSKYTSRYLDAGFSELFPFGYGLSYTSFDYSDLTVKDAGDHLDIAVKLRNTGDRKGVETVQLYMQDVVGSIVRPVKELKGFKKVALDSGAETVVELRLDKADMGFYNDQGEYLLENGKFRIYVGGNSRDCLMQELTIHFNH
jgi:beta-glucosidase